MSILSYLSVILFTALLVGAIFLGIFIQVKLDIRLNAKYKK